MQTEGGSVYAKSELDTMDYFNWLISPNDLLFISFHPLPDLVDDQLAGNSFDMIALVDSVSVSRNANSFSLFNCDKFAILSSYIFFY